MSQNSEWENFGITSDELDRFTNAFKSDKFRELFSDYCKEISDPENCRIYEEELKQFEAERGNNVTFIKPEPGFVIKTSTTTTTTTNKSQKVFINVAHCVTIEKPSSKRGIDPKTGQIGLNWRIPYVQSKPKHDFDRNKQMCAVFDVIFHSDTLHLASKNLMFKNLVIDTACDAVQSVYDITLDMCNLKYPKMFYKGTPTSVLLRKKKNTESPTKSDKSMKILKNDAINNANANANANTIKTTQTTDGYCTPKYELIHRRHVEMHELTDEMDAKLNITLPKELIIKINLPLLSSAKDVVLDVNTKTIHLCCEQPAMYKLGVNLPYEVDKEIGTAQFDGITKVLTVTLPVLKKRQLGIMDLCRQDSGIESDHHNSKEEHESIALENDVFDEVADPKKIPLDLSQETLAIPSSTNDDSDFLDSSICYALPPFTYNRFENIVAFTMHVKNVEPDSIVAYNNANTYRLKFTSIGNGCFENYYAFYFSISNDDDTIAITEMPRVEAWDNNVVVQIELNSIEMFHSYVAGISESDCKTFICTEQKTVNNKHGPIDDVEPVVKNSKINYVEIETAMSNKEFQIEITNTNFKAKHSTETHETQVLQRTKRKKSKSIDKKKVRSLSESHCDQLKQTDNINRNDSVNVNESEKCCQHIICNKTRTQSESSTDEHQMDIFPLKGILKRHSSYDRTTCDGSLDEPNGCSVDLGIGSFKSIPEKNEFPNLSESIKKTVRFDKQLCRKLLFRMNSTIIGQRKPKENKRKKKKPRSQERRYSEGEASDYENHMQSGQLCDGDKCQKNYKNNCSNNNNNNTNSNKTKINEPELKNNLIFDIEI